MEKFESVFEAVRHIKNHLPDDDFDSIYLMYRDFYDRCYVTHDSDELADKIGEEFYSWGYESGDPESHAELYSIWDYTVSENKEKYGHLYRGYKRTLLSQSHIRGKLNAAGEVVASFAISI